MEEHPELSPAEATKRAMAEITAPIIAITLVLLSVFVPVAFIPGISGELFRQFAVTVAVVDVPVGDQRADAVAGAVRRAAAGRITGRGAGRSACVMRVDRPGARRLWRRRRAPRALLGHRPRAGRRRRGRHRRAREGDADRLPAGGRSGRLLRRRAAAGRRLGRPHRRGDRAGRGDPQEEEAVADYHLGHRLELHRQLLAVQLPPSSSSR